MVQPPPLLKPSSAGPSTVRPIPEDFFQNTISSIQAAASLPPAGTFLSKLDQNSQGIENNKVPANQDSIRTVGGVPPQATQQPVQYEPVGLPDGGIPPQYSPQLPAQSQQHVQMAQVPVSTQPLDLSSLETPGSETSGKPPTRSASPPRAVRPGQVVTSSI